MLRPSLTTIVLTPGSAFTIRALSMCVLGPIATKKNMSKVQGSLRNQSLHVQSIADTCPTRGRVTLPLVKVIPHNLFTSHAIIRHRATRMRCAHGEGCAFSSCARLSLGAGVYCRSVVGIMMRLIRRGFMKFEFEKKRWRVRSAVLHPSECRYYCTLIRVCFPR
jgi:hypothetical protein